MSDMVPKEQLFTSYVRERRAAVDRLMLVILLAQWVLAIALALIVSPYSWAGKERSVHLHVHVAIFLGAAINVLPVTLILKRPGWWFTRQVVAVSQMLWSALLIHLTGGRIETHFHVFGSLAFIAFYRDWTLLASATVVVAADHLLRGLLLPESVYGTANPEWWRFLEHAFWVVFEDLVLYLNCVRGIADFRLMAEREAALNDLNGRLEQGIARRTRELSETNHKLTQSLDQLQGAQRALIEASRKAGMAEVATSVLHNVGNVLNSVNVSANLLTDTVHQSAAKRLGKVCELFQKQGPDMRNFLEREGERVVAYLNTVSEAVTDEQERLLGELRDMQANIDHIKTIVATQQAHARHGGVIEVLRLQDLIEDALRISASSDVKHAIQIVRELEELPSQSVDRHKVLQILLNLISNARHAVLAQPAGHPRRITVRLRREDETIVLQVADTGVGIGETDLPKIFSYGHTTKKDGHGFGLHSCACSAMELGGELTAHSEGRGHGATFTLRLPDAACRSAA